MIQAAEQLFAASLGLNQTQIVRAYVSPGGTLSNEKGNSPINAGSIVDSGTGTSVLIFGRDFESTDYEVYLTTIDGQAEIGMQSVRSVSINTFDRDGLQKDIIYGILFIGNPAARLSTH